MFLLMRLPLRARRRRGNGNGDARPSGGGRGRSGRTAPSHRAGGRRHCPAKRVGVLGLCGAKGVQDGGGKEGKSSESAASFVVFEGGHPPAAVYTVSTTTGKNRGLPSVPPIPRNKSRGRSR